MLQQRIWGAGGATAPERDAAAYRRRMERRRQVQQQRVQARQEEKGLRLVFTGQGEGENHCGSGLGAAHPGSMGSRWRWCSSSRGPGLPGEGEGAGGVPGSNCTGMPWGKASPWTTQDRERDREMVNRAWRQACRYLPDAAVKLVLLDEINVALKLGLHLPGDGLSRPGAASPSHPCGPHGPRRPPRPHCRRRPGDRDDRGAPSLSGARGEGPGGD